MLFFIVLCSDEDRLLRPLTDGQIAFHRLFKSHALNGYILAMSPVSCHICQLHSFEGAC